MEVDSILSRSLLFLGNKNKLPGEGKGELKDGTGI